MITIHIALAGPAAGQRIELTIEQAKYLRRQLDELLADGAPRPWPAPPAVPLYAPLTPWQPPFYVGTPAPHDPPWTITCEARQ